MAVSDTSDEAARVQRAAIASMPGSARTAMAFEMSEVVYQLTIDGIRRRQPGIEGPDLTLALIERLHGPEVAAAVAESDTLFDGS